MGPGGEFMIVESMPLIIASLFSFLIPITIVVCLDYQNAKPFS